MEAQRWLNAPRVPLGVLHDGECRAKATPFYPAQEQLTRQCNVGYSRGVCQCFPLDAEADAFRFHILTDRDSRLEIQYIVEKACWPVRQGTVSLRNGVGDDILVQQASVFADCYRRRRED